MKTLYLDLFPAYIPFIVQCMKAAGDAVDPTVDNLIIYEEGGANATFDSGTITGSPFDPAKVNTKTGLWGVLVAKTAFTAGKFYIALWEMTVDGVATAMVEKYFACNASQFKADVSGLATQASVDTIDTNVDTIVGKLPAGSIGDATAAGQTSILNALNAAGVGARQITIQLYVSGTTTPISDVDVWIFDATNTNQLRKGRSNASGQVAFNLDDGTRKVRLSKGGVTFAAPETIVVSADGTKIIYGTVVEIGTPVASNACRVYEWCFKADGVTPMASVTAEARIVNLPYDYDGKLHSGDLITNTYDALTGKLYWDIVWGATVEITIDGVYPSVVTVTVPESGSARLKTLAG